MDVKTNCPHFQNGDPDCKTAFVFSCPGKAEEKLGLPVSGTSGKYLNYALRYLHAQAPELFPYPCKSKYRITNAWPEVEYIGKTGRTQATSEEIIQQSNLSRLTKELRGSGLVVAIGDRAIKTLSALYPRKDFPNVVHPSGRGFNKHYKATGSTREKRVDKRIQMWVKDILSEIRNVS